MFSNWAVDPATINALPTTDGLKFWPPSIVRFARPKSKFPDQLVQRSAAQESGVDGKCGLPSGQPRASTCTRPLARSHLVGRYARLLTDTTLNMDRHTKAGGLSPPSGKKESQNSEASPLSLRRDAAREHVPRGHAVLRAQSISAKRGTSATEPSSRFCLRTEAKKPKSSYEGLTFSPKAGGHRRKKGARLGCPRRSELGASQG